MSTLAFTPISAGIRTASALVTLNAVTDALAASGTYQGTANNVSAVGWEYVVFVFDYTKGDETTLQIRPEGSPDDGSTWVPLGYQAAQGSGVSELTKDILQITGTLRVATRPMSCKGYKLVRCSLNTTGGTPTGTCVVTATAGIRISGRSA